MESTQKPSFTGGECVLSTTLIFTLIAIQLSFIQFSINFNK